MPFLPMSGPHSGRSRVFGSGPYEAPEAHPGAGGVSPPWMKPGGGGLPPMEFGPWRQGPSLPPQSGWQTPPPFGQLPPGVTYDQLQRDLAAQRRATMYERNGRYYVNEGDVGGIEIDRNGNYINRGGPQTLSDAWRMGPQAQQSPPQPQAPPWWAKSPAMMRGMAGMGSGIGSLAGPLAKYTLGSLYGRR